MQSCKAAIFGTSFGWFCSGNSMMTHWEMVPSPWQFCGRALSQPPSDLFTSFVRAKRGL